MLAITSKIEQVAEFGKSNETGLVISVLLLLLDESALSVSQSDIEFGGSEDYAFSEGSAEVVG